MANSITKLSVGAESLVYYDPGFRQLIEDHLPLIRDSAGTKILYVSPEMAWAYRGWFYDYLLKELRVPHHLHWFILRLSGFMSSEDVDETLSMIYLPSEIELAQLASLYSAGHTVITVS